MYILINVSDAFIQSTLYLPFISSIIIFDVLRSPFKLVYNISQCFIILHYYVTVLF